ncbi:MAG TPA: TetR/AcrR family transcriptional regulator [Acidimicrobiales bacterium]|jgi:AcrR family transcriptional regulator|nr:TetR/AcrR family transcriptional regulator [Acidimicrobiales bacterium]
MDQRTRKRSDTRAALYDAAIQLMRDVDYDDLTVEQICLAAGIGRATFFRHFDGKSGLIRDFNRRLAERAEQEMLALGPGASATAQLSVVQECLAQAWIGAHPGVRKMGLDAARVMDPSGRDVHPELLGLVIAIVRHGLATEELTSELPLELVAFLVVAHLAAATGYWFGSPASDLTELTRAALGQCLTGLAGSAPTPVPVPVPAIRRSR